MTYNLQNTFSIKSSISYNKWRHKEEAFIASLKSQPLVIVLRPEIEVFNKHVHKESFLEIVNKLISLGILHIEVAWSPHQKWADLMKDLLRQFNNISLGAASVTNSEALLASSQLGLNYAMCPFWDKTLQTQAIELEQLLIPGVLSPTEIRQATSFGCRIVKLFPAGILGTEYLNQLKSPLGSLPFIIGAGGLKAKDLKPLLSNGYDAIAIGKGLIKNNEIDPLLNKWLKNI